MVRFCLLIFLLLNLLQSPAAQSPVVEWRRVPAAQWEKAGGGLDYSKDRAEIEQKPREDRMPDLNPGLNWRLPPIVGKILQLLAIGLGLVVIAFGVYRLLQQPANNRIAGQAMRTLEHVEQNLPETDIEVFLREAIENGHFTLAIRLYFLLVIQRLSARGWVAWTRDKTNRDYLSEMRGKPVFPTFREATLQYERIWYGNQTLDKEAFEPVEQQFRKLLAQV